MILVDTNVLMDFWKAPSQVAKSVFEQEEIAICGVIKTEVLRGSRSVEEFNRLEKALNCFEYLDFNEKDWICLAEDLVRMKNSGISVPMQDAMIAYLAIKNNCKLWSNDKHFLLIKTVLSELSLFVLE